MKQVKYIFFCTIFFIFFTEAHSQNIVYVNLDKIIKNSKAGSELIKFYNDKNKETIDKIKIEEQKIRDMEKSLISQKNILEAEEYKKKSDIVSNEIINFNKNNQKIMKELNLNKDKSIQLLIKDINIILEEYAINNKIDIIMSSNQILIGKSNLDVTNKILEIVDSKIKKFKK